MREKVWSQDAFESVSWGMFDGLPNVNHMIDRLENRGIKTFRVHFDVLDVRQYVSPIGPSQESFQIDGLSLDKSLLSSSPLHSW